MLIELSDIIRQKNTGGVVVLLHLDLLTTTTRSGLNLETRESIAWFYVPLRLRISFGSHAFAGRYFVACPGVP